MTTQVQHRRGTGTQHAGFAGAEGEFTYDTSAKRLIAHDGVTPGGFPAQRLDQPARLLAVPDQASRLALSPWPDLSAVRQTDSGAVHLLAAGADPSVAANWQAIAADAYSRAEADAGLAAKADLVAGKVPLAQLPDLNTAGRKIVVADEAARLALAPYPDLTLANQADTGDVWALGADASPSMPANWTKVGTVVAGGVSAVFGRNGAVVAQAGDYDAGQVSYAGAVTGSSNVAQALDALKAGQPATIVASVAAASKGGIAVGGSAAAPSLALAAANLDSLPPGTWGTAGSGLFATDAGGAPKLLDPASLVGGLPLATAAAGSDLVPALVAGGARDLTLDDLFRGRLLRSPELTGYAETVQALTISGNTVLPAATGGNTYDLTLAATATVTLPAAASSAGRAVTICVTQNGTGGFGLTFAAPAGDSLKILAGTSLPTPATGAGKTSLYAFYKLPGRSFWLAEHLGSEG